MTKNFKIHEFECKCGCDMPDDVRDNILKLAVELQKLRDKVGVPFSPTNAYRCKEHNANVGGVPFSQHLLGKAADLKIEGFTPDEVADMVEEMMDNGDFLMGGVGRYDTFTHVDIRKKRARWNNKSK